MNSKQFHSAICHSSKRIGSRKAHIGLGSSYNSNRALAIVGNRSITSNESSGRVHLSEMALTAEAMAFEEALVAGADDVFSLDY